MKIKKTEIVDVVKTTYSIEDLTRDELNVIKDALNRTDVARFYFRWNNPEPLEIKAKQLLQLIIEEEKNDNN